MVKATWNGAVLAQSEETVVVEGNHYFPPDAIQKQFFKPTSTETTCHWKGVANYYSIEVDGKVNRDAAWYYARPLPEAAQLGISGYVAFWKGVVVA